MTTPFQDLLRQYPTAPRPASSPFQDLLDQANGIYKKPEEEEFVPAPMPKPPAPKSRNPFAAGMGMQMDTEEHVMRKFGEGAVRGAANLFQLPKNVMQLAGQDPAQATDSQFTLGLLDSISSKINAFADKIAPVDPPSSKIVEYAGKGAEFLGSMIPLVGPFSKAEQGVELLASYAPSIIRSRAAQAVASITRGIANPAWKAGVTAALESAPAQVATGVGIQAALDPASVQTGEGVAKAAAFSTLGMLGKGWAAGNPNPVVAGLTGPKPTMVSQSLASLSASPDEARFAYGQMIGKAPKVPQGIWQDFADWRDDIDRQFFQGKKGFKDFGGEKSAKGVSFEDRANLLSGTAKIQHEAIYDTPFRVNDKTGAWEPTQDPGLTAIYEIIKPEEQQSFSGYLLARHRLDPGVEGSVRTGKYSHPDETGALAQMATISPPSNFVKAAEIFDNLNRINLDNTLSTDMTNLVGYDWMSQNYPSFASAARSLGSREIVAPLAKRVGSTEHSFIDPLIAYTSATKQLIAKGRINQFANQMYDYALTMQKRNPSALEGQIELTPEKPFFHQADVDNIIADGAREGITIDRTIAETVASIKRAGEIDPASGRLNFLRNGAPVSIRVNSDIAEGLSMFRPDPSTNLVSGIRAVEKVPRTATSLFLDLSGLGLLKDSPLAYINAPKEAGLNPFQIISNPIRGLREIKNKGAYYYEMVGEGGGVGGRYIGEGAIEANRTAQLVADHARMSGIKFAIKHPIALLEQISSDLSNSTRMGMYMRLRDNGMTAAQAAVEARRVLADPFQGGASAKMKAWASATSFGNTGLQEIRNIARVAANDPARAGLKGVIISGIPAAISWSLAELTNDDQIREMRAAPGGSNFDYWRVGDTVVGTPRAWAVGQFFGQGMTTFLDALKGDDTKKQWAQGFLNQVSVNILPLSVQQAYTMKSGEQFMGPLSKSVGLMPGAQEGMDPTMMGTSRTSNAAKFLADKTGIDPFRWDAVMKGMMTPDGYKIEQLVERAAGVAGFTDKKPFDMEASDIPLLQRYLKPYPTTNVASMKSFYDNYAKYSEINKTITALEAQGRIEDLQSYLTKHAEEAAIAPAYIEMGSEIASMRKIMELVAVQPESGFSPADKRRQIDQTTLDMISMVREFNKAMKPKLK